MLSNEDSERADGRLVDRLRSSDTVVVRKAILEVTNRCRPYLLEILLKSGGFEHELDDFVQETFVRFPPVVQREDYPRERDNSIISLFATIAKNSRSDRIRLRKTPSSSPPTLTGLEDVFDTQDLWKEYDQLFLSKEERAVPELNYTDRLKHILEQLRDEHKRDVFLEKVFSNDQPQSDFDALLFAIIIQAYALGRNHKMNVVADQGRAQLIENADVHARMIAPKVREIINNGASTLQELADGLNQAGIPTKNGNDWIFSNAKLLIERLNKLEPDQPITLNKDAYLSQMTGIIKQVQQAGAKNPLAIANALNDQNITTKSGKKWYAQTVKQLLEKIEQLKKGESGPTPG